MANFYEIMRCPSAVISDPDPRPKRRGNLPPTPGYNKLSPASRAAADSRAKAYEGDTQ